MSINKLDNEQDIEKLRLKVIRALAPISQMQDNTYADKNFLFTAREALNYKDLPQYYLLYFLFVDLLKYKNLGASEKIAWSIPIDYKGKAYLLELAKFGVHLMAHDPSNEKKEIKEMQELINKAIEIAQPYFKYIANKAIDGNKINIKNNSIKLYNRYLYFLRKYKKCKIKLNKELNKPPKIEKINNCTKISYNNVYLYNQELENLLIAMLESFFSWTEHIFVLLAIIYGHFNSGKDILNFINNKWNEKYKKVIDIEENKEIYDKLLIIKNQLRNYNTHGTFGRNGETFYFHTGTGAVPVFLNDSKNLSIALEQKKYEYIEDNVINTLENFIKYLWTGNRKNAKLLIQDSNLDLIMTYSTDKTYKNLIKSKNDTLGFIDNLCWEIDRAANMEF